jgi:VWFA-related protein
MRLTAHSLASGLAIVLLLAPVRAQDPQQPRPIFRSDAHFVTVDAYPLKDGKVVEGLTKADFAVEEDGQPQTIESFEFITAAGGIDESVRRDPNTVRESQLLAADARTRAFVVYLDIPHVTVEGANRTRGPLVSMLNAMVGDTDLFGITTPYQAPQDLTFGRKLVSAEDMLTRHWKWGTRDTERRSPLEEEFVQCFPADSQGREGWIRDGQAMRPVADVLSDRAREEQTITHLEALVSYLGHLREGRTSIVLFTEGWRLFNDDGGLMSFTGRSRAAVCDQHLIRYANLNLQLRFRDLLSLANRANVTFYPVNPTGLMAFDSSIARREMGTGNISESPMVQGLNNLRDRASNMQAMAANTDGIAVVNTNDLKTGLQKVSDQLRSYYLLGYYSTNRKFDGKARRISVKVKQPGIDVKARRGYTAPTEAERAARATASSAPAAAAGPTPVEAALASLARIRPSSELFLEATLGAGPSGRLTVIAEISGAQLARGVLSKGGTLDITLTAPGGASVGSTQVALAPAARSSVTTMDVPADTKAVTVSAKLKDGTVVFDARTDVTRDSSQLFGAPVVYRATPSSRSPLFGVAGFEFRRTERVHVDVPIAQNLERREARILGRSGQPMAVSVNVTEREADGRLLLGVDVLLAPLGPGDYVIEITGTANGKTESRLIGIRVSN